MVTFNYELGKTNSKGNTPIYIRICVDRQIKRIRFYADAAPGDLTSKGEIKNASLELAVTDKMQEYRRKMLNASSDAANWNVDEVYKYLTEENQSKKQDDFNLDFFEFGYKHVDRLLKEGKVKTSQGYATALRNFQKYLGTDKIDINSINKNMLLGYKEWFEENDFGARAFELYMSNLQSLHNRAKLYYNDEDDEKLNIKLSPFKNVQFKRNAAEKRLVEKRALTPATLKYLYNVPYNALTPRAQLARDAFFLSFALCGMNAVDMMQHVQKEDCERDLIEYYRSKTVGRTGKDAFISMHLHPMFKTEHERMRGKRHTWCFAERYSASDNFNAALNKGLKELTDAAVLYYSKEFGLDPESKRKAILKKLDIPGDLTFYSARHSFATIAANDCHVPTETVDRCLCHVVNSVAAQSYIKKDYKFTDETIKAVVEVVFGK